MIYVKFHDGVIAVCDAELIGRVISDGKVEIKVSEYFYKGELKTIDEVKDIMKKPGNFNIIGKESVELAVKVGIVNKKNIMKLKGIPHAQAISY